MKKITRHPSPALGYFIALLRQIFVHIFEINILQKFQNEDGPLPSFGMFIFNFI